MKQIIPYLMFDGHCARAMRFYEKCLGGTLEMFPYSEAPLPEFKTVKDRTMHASLRSGPAHLLAADCMPGEPPTAGNNIHVSLSFDSVPETEKAFLALSEGGKVTMPLQKTFWSASFGMLTDAFGIHWMLNCEQS